MFCLQNADKKGIVRMALDKQRKARAHEEEAYDDVRYESYVFAQTHPEHLFAMASLFKLPCPDFKACRVLEIGCADPAPKSRSIL